LKESADAGQLQQRMESLLNGSESTFVKPQPVDIDQLRLMYWPDADAWAQQ
jgi:hypothetical protein